jgi:hypothetical protein
MTTTAKSPNMINELFQTSDGHIHPTKSCAQRHSASVAISDLVKENCTALPGAGLTYDVEAVTHFLITNIDGIDRLVDTYQIARPEA